MVPVSASSDASCDINLSFGSTSSGIDGNLFREIKAYLARASFVSNASVKTWGREGERDICVVLKRGADPGGAFADIVARLPTSTSRGWVKITSRAGTSYYVARAR